MTVAGAEPMSRACTLPFSMGSCGFDKQCMERGVCLSQCTDLGKSVEQGSLSDGKAAFDVGDDDGKRRQTHGIWPRHAYRLVGRQDCDKDIVIS